MEKYYMETFRLNGFQGEKNEILRALILMDSVCCEMIADNERGSVWWDRINEQLKEFRWSDQSRISFFSEELLKSKRKYFYMLSRGKSLNSFAASFRAAVHTRLLFLISQDALNRSWKGELEKFTEKLREGWYRIVRKEIIDEYVNNYWDAKKALNGQDMERLKFLNGKFKEASETMRGVLFFVYDLDQRSVGNISVPKAQSGVVQRDRSGQERTALKTDGAQSGENRAVLISKESRIALLCMIESYLSENPDSTDRGWNQYLEDNWKKYFPEMELSGEIRCEIKDLLMLEQDHSVRMRGNVPNYRRYFKALGKVISNGGLQKIRSESAMRSLVLNRTVAMTVSLLEYSRAGQKDPEVVIQDIMAYLSHINYVTYENEVDDITESVDLYLEDGHFNPESVKRVAQHREMWKKSFHEIKDCLNKKNKAVSVLNDRIDEMENILAKANYNVLKRLVLDLDRSGFGYQLGKLYRFAAGMDSPSVDELREQMRGYFDQLNNMGIKPIAGNLLDTQLEETDELYDSCVPVSADQTVGRRVLLYPGWSVSESAVAPPVYRMEQFSEQIIKEK